MLDQKEQVKDILWYWLHEIKSSKTKKMKEVTVKLTLDELNLIFKALGNEPFREVYELIGKLNEQTNAQLSEDE